MSQQQRDNSGALFKNTRKQKDTHPDYEGNITIGGREYWLSAWLKAGKNGTFMSIAAKPKETQTQRQQSAPLGAGPVDLDDSIPFMYEWR